MPDDDKKPSPGGVPIVRISERQAQSVKHRDHSVARSRSQAEPPPFVEEEHTEQYELGEISKEELHVRRRNRDTGDRLTRLEESRDYLKASVARVEANQAVTDSKVDKLSDTVNQFSGQMTVIPSLVEAMQDATKALRERDHVTFTAKVDVDKAAAMDQIDAKADERKVEVHKAKAKWDIITKVVAVIASIAAVISTSIAAGC